MKLNNIYKVLIPIGSFAIGLGFDVSGIENPYLAITFFAIGVLSVVVFLSLWLLPKLPWRLQRKADENAEVIELEVPPELIDKIIGTPTPKGRILEVKGKVVKRKITKRGNDEV